MAGAIDRNCSGASNSQLGLPCNDSPTHSMLYQPDMYVTDPDMDNLYNGDIVHGAAYYQGFTGKNRRSKGWSNTTGGACDGVTALSVPKLGAVCINGRAIYNPAIYAVAKRTKSGLEKIEYNRCVCAARKAAKQPDDAMPTGGVPDTGSGSGSGSSTNGTMTQQGASGMSTGVKVAIGTGVVGLLVVGVLIFKKK